MIRAPAISGGREHPRERLAEAERRQQRRQRNRSSARSAIACSTRDPRRRDQALQRHLRGDAEHDHHDERAQIAAAEQHQRARAAAVRQHHAVAEQQSAEEHQRRRERRLQIDRLAEIDDAARRQQLRRGDRDAERQRIGPDQAAVAIGPPAAQAAEQAEAAQQADRAIGETDQRGRSIRQCCHRPALAFPEFARPRRPPRRRECNFRAAITSYVEARPRLSSAGERSCRALAARE